MPKVKAGTLKERIDRAKKKLAEGGEKMDRARVRVLKKRLRRAQRARRALLAHEARIQAMAAKAKKGAEEKKEEPAPAAQ